MKTKARGFFIIIGIISLTSLNLGATSLGEQCASRIKVLQSELNKILQKRHYALKKRASMQESKRLLNLSSEDYKKITTSLKDQYTQGLAALKADNEAEHRAHMVACLLDSRNLLQKLKQVAESGDKELDDFSKNWRACFPG